MLLTVQAKIFFSTVVIASGTTISDSFAIHHLNVWDWDRERMKAFLGEEQKLNSVLHGEYPAPDEIIQEGSVRTISYWDVKFSKSRTTVDNGKNTYQWAISGIKISMVFNSDLLKHCEVLERITARDQPDFRMFQAEHDGPSWTSSCREWANSQ